MVTIETYMLHGICLRLIHRLPAKHPEALILARWIAGHPEIFGSAPHATGTGRGIPKIGAQPWSLLVSHISERLRSMTVPTDEALFRLAAIAAHLNLAVDEETILRFLVLQQRRGPIAEFATMMEREIGLSTEAVVARCCNLDDEEVWTALAPQGRLVTLGLVQTDSTLAVMRDDPYTLSGLLLALLHPPLRREQILELR